jgi:hypothetical protein
VSGLTHPIFGLEVLVEILEARFEHDSAGRLAGFGKDASGGVLPRFVLGRALEGVIWRFRWDVSTNLVQRVARLAGRESGIPIDTGDCPARPERFFAIERLLAEEVGLSVSDGGTLHERVVRDGITVGEIWTVA